MDPHKPRSPKRCSKTRNCQQTQLIFCVEIFLLFYARQPLQNQGKRKKLAKKKSDRK